VGIAVGTAILIAIPLGIFLTRPRFKQLGQKVISVINIGQAVPSLAMIAIFMPLMGIGFKPAVSALILYGLLPIARNTLAGLNSIDENIKDSALGVGMSRKQVLFEIELPLAMPIIMAGIRTSTVITVGTATLSFLIGAGGLGRLIFLGIRMFKPEYLLIGSGSAAILAIVLDKILGKIESLFASGVPDSNTV
jgi:osmoprotectant transport system permease protein